MNRGHKDLALLGGIVSLPFLVCLVVMLTEPGLNRSLLVDGLKYGVVLVLIGAAMSFVASRFESRGDHG